MRKFSESPSGKLTTRRPSCVGLSPRRFDVKAARKPIPMKARLAMRESAVASGSSNKRGEPYVPPSDDDAPLDAIEEALVRALVSVIVRELQEAAAGASSG